MTNRKFTPPTEFPTEYVDGNGDKNVILGIGPNKKFPLIGYGRYGDPYCWTEHGEVYPEQLNRGDLHDIPKRITTWHNVYDKGVYCSHDGREAADGCAVQTRLCVYRIERDEDGGNPTITVEDV